MTVLGVPAFLDSGCLPTKASIYNCYLKIREEGVKDGRFKVNSPISEICKTVGHDVRAQWEKTTIPTLFTSNPKKASKLISDLVTDVRSLLKTPIDRRSESFGSELEVLLDMAVCHHPNLESCSCSLLEKVPEAWLSFLQDQRGPRLQGKKLTKQSLSLRVADKLTPTEEEKNALQRERKREEKRAKVREEIGNDQLNRKESIAKNINRETKTKDIKDHSNLPHFLSYNTMSIHNTSSASLRFGVSDGATAAIASGFLCDLIENGHLDPSKSYLAMDSSKIYRGKLEAIKAAGEKRKRSSQKSGMKGIFYDELGTVSPG